MSTPETGGPAFPVAHTDFKDQCSRSGYPNTYSTGGMTLRDYAAIKFAAALISSGEFDRANQMGVEPEENEKALAFAAYWRMP